VWRYSINSVVGIPLSQMSIEILGLEFGLISIEVLVLSIMVHGDSLLHNAQNPNSSSGKTHHKKSYTYIDMNFLLYKCLFLI
jgi:hypothetical protein